MEILNAKVDEIYIGIEDHGIFCYQLRFSGDHWSQASPSIGNPPAATLRSVLDTLEVSHIGQVSGCMCRVKREKGFITEMGHIFKDKWHKFA